MKRSLSNNRLNFTKKCASGARGLVYRPYKHEAQMSFTDGFTGKDTMNTNLDESTRVDEVDERSGEEEEDEDDPDDDMAPEEPPSGGVKDDDHDEDISGVNAMDISDETFLSPSAAKFRFPLQPINLDQRTFQVST